MSKYAKRAASERALLNSLFAPEQDEKRGGYYGVEFGRKRPLDQGGGRERGAIRPDHAVARRHGTSVALGRPTGDRDFGPSDSYHGRRHLDSGIARPAYTPEQRLHAASDGAGLSG